MTKKCVVRDDYQGVALGSADWSVLADGVDVVTLDRHLPDEDAVVDALDDAEIVVIMRERPPFRASLLARLPKLELLVTSGMRNASIDLAAAAEHGVTVCGTTSTSTAPGELTWALILGLARHVVAESAGLRANGPWQRTVGTDLAGRTLGLLGYGKIGRKVAAVAVAFGMDVGAWSPTPPAERAEDARLAGSLAELAEVSDVLSIHLVLAGSTRGLVDADVLGKLKTSALLVNTSRAALVDQDALISGLRGGGRGGPCPAATRCPPTTPSGRCRTCWRPRTSATSQPATTRCTSRRSSRTSPLSLPGNRSARSEARWESAGHRAGAARSE